MLEITILEENFMWKHKNSEITIYQPILIFEKCRKMGLLFPCKLKIPIFLLSQCITCVTIYSKKITILQLSLMSGKLPYLIVVKKHANVQYLSAFSCEKLKSHISADCNECKITILEHILRENHRITPIENR
eukprot:UN22382